VAINKDDYPNKIENNLWADKNYTIYFYNFMFEKKRYRGIIDTTEKVSWNKKDKIAFAKMEIATIRSAKRETILNTSVTLDAFMEDHFKLQPDTNYTKTRKSFYERFVSPYCGKKKVVDLRQLHFLHAIKKQEEAKLQPRTIKQTLEVLNPAMKKAIANRLISFNPLDGIKIKLPSSKKIVSNAVDKLNVIHKAIVEEFGDDPFYTAFFLFALQGRRKGEILKLRWEDVDFKSNHYILRTTKNNEEQKIYLPETIKDNLEVFRESEGWVFTSRITGSHIVNIDKVVERMRKRLKDDSFGIHYLRNVMVSAMASQGFDSIHLSGALGHNDPNTIKKYLTMNYLKSSEMASGVIDAIVSVKKEEDSEGLDFCI
jgi:integrase